MIDRIINEFFPETKYTVNTYDDLIKLITKYCETREILMTEQDIEKIKTKFEPKYKDYLQKFGKGLPGGVKADVVFQQLSLKFGAKAAREAMKSISNVDYRTDLSP